MNGPLLVRNCEVIGFDRGVTTSRAVNGQVFEYITLRNQRRFGFDNEGQAISVRGLTSENSVTAVRSYGTFCLVEAQLKGTTQAARWPAIINYNGRRIFLRHIVSYGYARAIADVETPDWYAVTRIAGESKPGSLGPVVAKYCSHPATVAFAAVENSLRLPIKDPPKIANDPVSQWVNVDDFGADPTGNSDSSAAIQQAMNSGARTIFLPGTYAFNSTVTLGRKVQRVVGIGGMVDYYAKAKPDVRVVNGESRSSLNISHISKAVSKLIPIERLCFKVSRTVTSTSDEMPQVVSCFSRISLLTT
jgi:hypothetical protein